MKGAGMLVASLRVEGGKFRTLFSLRVSLAPSNVVLKVSFRVAHKEI